MPITSNLPSKYFSKLTINYYHSYLLLLVFLALVFGEEDTDVAASEMTYTVSGGALNFTQSNPYTEM